MTELERARWGDAAALVREAADALEKLASYEDDDYDFPGKTVEPFFLSCELCNEQSLERDKHAHDDGCIVPRLRDYAAGLESGSRAGPGADFPSARHVARIVTLTDEPDSVTLARGLLGGKLGPDSLFTVDRLEPGGWFRYLAVPVANLTERAATLDLKRASSRTAMPPRSGASSSSG